MYPAHIQNITKTLVITENLTQKKALKIFILIISTLFLFGCVTRKKLHSKYLFDESFNCQCSVKNPIISVGASSNYYKKEYAICNKKNTSDTIDSIYPGADSIYWTMIKIRTKYKPKNANSSLKILKQKKKYYSNNRIKAVKIIVIKNDSIIKHKWL